MIDYDIDAADTRVGFDIRDARLMAQSQIRLAIFDARFTASRQRGAPRAAAAEALCARVALMMLPFFAAIYASRH